MKCAKLQVCTKSADFWWRNKHEEI